MFGISTTVLQFVSQGETIPAPWFLSVRTLFAGIILLVISAFIYGKHIFDIFKTVRGVISLVAYAVLGLGANLLTFYFSVQYGNSAMSAILQYLAPLFVVIGMIVFQHKRPLWSDLLVFVIAIVGVTFALTKGDFSKLSIPMVSLIWGIGSGLTQALYIVLPRPLVKKHYPPMLILGWGAFIAGILFNLNRPVWVGVPKINMALILSVGCMILIGTVIPFIIVLHSSKFASSEVISLVDATEPIVTFILSIIFFNLQVNAIELVGAAMVIVAIAILQVSHGRLEKGFLVLDNRLEN
ncbi:MAG: EamA family transporter [Acetilactobacillus jinshanensis]